MKRKLIKLALVFILAASFISTIPMNVAKAEGRCYVNDDAGGTNNGNSWEDAYISLQSAIADTCTEIWVAAGTYKPQGPNRTYSFTLESGTAIYGGFAGTETDLSQRNILANPTILSGDLLGNDDGIVALNNLTRSDNSVHVVVSIGAIHTSILDGFTITSGNANGSDCPASYPGLASCGGGIYIINSNPTLRNLTLTGNIGTKGGAIFNNSFPALVNITITNNLAVNGGGMYNYYGSTPNLTEVTFYNNYALFDGAGMYNIQSSPNLTNITFSNNSTSGGYGGGIYNVTSSKPTLTNVTFNGNSAKRGGGMYNANSNSNLVNVTFSSNSAVEQGGGIYNDRSNPKLINVLISNSTNGGDCFNDINSALVPIGSYNNLIEDSSYACGLVNGQNGNIIGLDPNLGTLTNNGGYTETFALLESSPAINSGRNTGCPATDQRGITRPQGAICDIGAFEVEADPTVSSIMRASGNPTNASSINFTVTFSETVTGVDADGSDFELFTSDISDASITGVTPVSASVYTVTVHTGSGDGALRLDVPGTATIKDLTNHDLSGLPFTGEEYIIDKTMPTVSSITRTSASPSTAANVDFTVTFSEDVTGVDELDFENFTSGVIDPSITGVSGSGSTYIVTVNTRRRNGTIRLDVPNTASIKDLANNEIINLPFTLGETYTILILPPKPVSAPIPSQPRRNSISNNSTPTFVWNDVPNAMEYEIVIATDASFSQIVLTENVSSPSFTPPDPLADGKYFWRVRAYNAAAQSGRFSVAQIFSIDTTPPSAPVLTSPMNIATLRSSPVFRWTRVAGAVLYEFQYDNDADVSSPTYSVTTPNTYRKPPAMPNGTFFWRVRAKDAAGNWSDWSIIRSVSISR